MSTDEKPEGEPATPPPQPKVRVLEINLAELLGGRPKMTGIELIAAALATVTIFKECSESAPKHLEQMLQGAWRSVAEHLTGVPSAGWEIQAQVLGEYFQHAGDWSAMRQCLSGRGEQLQSEAGDFQRRYQSHLATARKEYADHYGSAV